MKRNTVVTLCIAVGVVVTGVCGFIISMNIDKKGQNSKMEQVPMNVSQVEEENEESVTQGNNTNNNTEPISVKTMEFEGIEFQVESDVNIDDKEFEISLDNAVNIGLEYITKTYLYYTTFETIDVKFATTSTSGIRSGSVAWNGIIEVDGDKRFEITINTQTGDVMDAQMYYKEKDQWVKEDDSSVRKEYKVEKLNLDAFWNIDVNIDYDADVEIIKGDSYGVIIHYIGPDYSINYTNEDGNLKIDDNGPVLKKQMTINIQQEKNYVTIIIPEDARLANINIEATSGDISLKGLIVNQLHLLTSSGDSSLVNVSTDKGDIQTTSGDITARDLQSNTLKMETTSGDITVKGNVYADSTFDATSGDIVIECSDQEKMYSYELATTAGSIGVNGKIVEDDIGSSKTVENSKENIIKATSTSGDIDIAFAGNEE